MSQVLVDREQSGLASSNYIKWFHDATSVKPSGSEGHGSLEIWGPSGEIIRAAAGVWPPACTGDHLWPRCTAAKFVDAAGAFVAGHARIWKEKCVEPQGRGAVLPCLVNEPRTSVPDFIFNDISRSKATKQMF